MAANVLTLTGSSIRCSKNGSGEGSREEEAGERRPQGGLLGAEGGRPGSSHRYLSTTIRESPS
jgi:hypothetical protein